jgi:hypothetical protein
MWAAKNNVSELGSHLMSETAELLMIPYAQRMSMSSTPASEGKTAYVLIDPGIFLARGLVPDDVSRGKTHDDVEMGDTLGNLVHVMAETMGLGKQDFGQLLFLIPG